MANLYDTYTCLDACNTAYTNCYCCSDYSKAVLTQLHLCARELQVRPSWAVLVTGMRAFGYWSLYRASRREYCFLRAVLVSSLCSLQTVLHVKAWVANKERMYAGTHKL